MLNSSHSRALHGGANVCWALQFGPSVAATLQCIGWLLSVQKRTFSQKESQMTCFIKALFYTNYLKVKADAPERLKGISHNRLRFY